ncbi:MAG: (2Fe-2S) ferredoxin domain-containing protein [Acidobacteria bacterium]|jgi:(2Fe-2S) ferredoxin|nr:(2Fe-2S) ferredoxin domain-containing protein [Acidobacteriota bacterium]
MAKFEKHIFVCGNVRPAGHPRGCCDPAAKAELQVLFKQKLAEHGLKGRIRANQAGCLDQCEHGPTVVVYPEGVWYGQVTPGDVDEIVQSHILSGKPVERLRLADNCLNTAHCEHRQRS